MPFSAGFDTKLWFDRAFLQRSVRLDIDKLEAQCVRWLGHPLEEPLRFALRPFSDELEEIWRRTLSYVWCGEERGLPLGPAAKAAPVGQTSPPPTPPTVAADPARKALLEGPDDRVDACDCR